MDIIAKGQEVLKYIPQRPPFVFVDKLIKIDKNLAISGLTISESILNRNHIFQESGLIENMAQTCALYAGYSASQKGIETPIGFIAAIKNVVVKSLPKIEQNLTTRVEIVNELMDMQIALASVYSEDNEEIASCELRIFIKNQADDNK